MRTKKEIAEGKSMKILWQEYAKVSFLCMNVKTAAGLSLCIAAYSNLTIIMLSIQIALAILGF